MLIFAVEIQNLYIMEKRKCFKQGDIVVYPQRNPELSEDRLPKFRIVRANDVNPFNDKRFYVGIVPVDEQRQDDTYIVVKPELLKKIEV